MEIMQTVKDELWTTYENMVKSIVGSAPKILSALVLIILALVVSKAIQKILAVVLRRLGTDGLVARLGIDQVLGRLGITRPFSQVVPQVIYYLLLFLFARTAADALGLVPVSQALGSFLAFVPNLVSALLILVLGSLAGQFAGQAVAAAADGSGLDIGRALGKAVSGLIFFVAVIMAVSQLHIDTDIVRIVTLCSLSGLALAFGLSFGLGSRETTRNILAGFYARRIFKVGEPVELPELRGKLVGFTPTTAILEADDRTVVVPNRVLMDGVVKQ